MDSGGISFGCFGDVVRRKDLAANRDRVRIFQFRFCDFYWIFSTNFVFFLSVCLTGIDYFGRIRGRRRWGRRFTFFRFFFARFLDARGFGASACCSWQKRKLILGFWGGGGRARYTTTFNFFRWYHGILVAIARSRRGAFRHALFGFGPGFATVWRFHCFVGEFLGSAKTLTAHRRFCWSRKVVFAPFLFYLFA